MTRFAAALGIAGALFVAANGSASAQTFGGRAAVAAPEAGVQTVQYYREDFGGRRGRDEDFGRGRGRGVVEERIIRRDVPRRTVCRTVIRERVTPGGVVIRRPVEVCRSGGGYGGGYGGGRF